MPRCEKRFRLALGRHPRVQVSARSTSPNGPSALLVGSAGSVPRPQVRLNLSSILGLRRRFRCSRWTSPSHNGPRAVREGHRHHVVQIKRVSQPLRFVSAHAGPNCSLEYPVFGPRPLTIRVAMSCGAEPGEAVDDVTGWALTAAADGGVDRGSVGAVTGADGVPGVDALSSGWRPAPEVPQEVRVRSASAQR